MKIIQIIEDALRYPFSDWKKTLILGIGVVIIVGILIVNILASGLIETNSITKVNMTNNTYSGEGVSFNIPSNWHVSKLVDGSTTNVFIDKYGSTYYTRITVAVSSNPEGMSDLAIISEIQNPSNPSSWQKISNSTMTVDGNTAYETTFIVDDSTFSPEIMKVQQIIFSKNGNTYGLEFQAPDKDFDQEKSNFNITLNSFKVL
jgi:hypothetical protein